MIQVFKIVSEKHTTNPTVGLNLSNVFNTRGNIYKMQLTHMHCNLRKLFSSYIIIAVWNSLPSNIVNAEFPNIFKNCLNRFWVNREFKFNWHAELEDEV